MYSPIWQIQFLDGGHDGCETQSIPVIGGLVARLVLSPKILDYLDFGTPTAERDIGRCPPRTTRTIC